ncbi:hypothetical protein QUF79_00900 [Fictibacillus enclensis]|uniref:hypothetical protein n=1 Tax=Fictibacillus enclensis TaxID=1017270 RepID=UPI0025A157DB|nr:hypothetical protein [Fictibacillus enclensis]MDM5196646.1 hypothetical protein [Fictibacillus enclensis]
MKILSVVFNTIITFIKEYYVYILVLTLLASIFYFAFIVEIAHKNAKGFLDSDFWIKNLLPNIIADVIGIILTSFVITGLYANHQKKKELKSMYSIFGVKFDRLIDITSRNILYLIYKNEGYLTWINEYGVQADLNKLIENKMYPFDFYKFNKPLHIWDFTDVSPIHDDFVVFTPRVKKHFRNIQLMSNEIQNLFDKRDLLEYEINQTSTDSYDYDLLTSEYEIVKKQLRKKVRLEIPKTEKLFEFGIQECTNGMINLFNEKVEAFNKDYSFIVPIEIRLSFIDISNNLNSVNSCLRSYNSPDRFNKLGYSDVFIYKEAMKREIYNGMVKVIEELLMLSSIFEKVKKKRKRFRFM